MLWKIFQLINISQERKLKSLKNWKRGLISIIIAENLSWIEFKDLVNLPSLPGIVPEVDLKRFYTKKGY